jgi:hypothetical protein
MNYKELQFNKRYKCSCPNPSVGYFSFIGKNDLPVFVKRRVSAVDLGQFESTCTEGWEEVDEHVPAI